MYQGSMVGAGSHVFAVWGYCISCADPEDHTVDLNPMLLATIIGETEDRVVEAIAFLSAPDPKSHCQDHDGRRLLPQGGHAYFLVTHEQYRNVKNSEELRQYFRETKRKQRLSKNVQDNTGHSQDPVCVSGSDKSKESKFPAFWEAYPKGGHKVNRAKCKKYWEAQKLDAIADTILVALGKHKVWERWTKEGGRYICAPLVWLHQARWEAGDDLTPARRRGPNI